jgi:hypothetical protein
MARNETIHPPEGSFKEFLGSGTWIDNRRPAVERITSGIQVKMMMTD